MQNTVTSETTANSSVAAGGTSNTNASTTTTNTSAAAEAGTSSSGIDLYKFPTHLISMDTRNDDAEQIFKSILLLAKNAGGWSNAFGHKKKKPFMEKAAESLFNINGQFNQ
jgi:hypothetical protein